VLQLSCWSWWEVDMRLVAASVEELICWWLLLEEKVEIVGVVEDGGSRCTTTVLREECHSGAGEGAGLLVAVFGNAWGGGCGGERERRCWIKKTEVGGWFLFKFGLSFLYTQTMKSTPIYMGWKRNILSLIVPNLCLWFSSKGS